jgi:hypothetical protein
LCTVKRSASAFSQLSRSLWVCRISMVMVLLPWAAAI